MWLCNQTNRKTSRLLYRVLGVFKLTVAAPHFFDRIKWSVIWCLCGLKKVNTAHAIGTVCPVENSNLHFQRYKFSFSIYLADLNILLWVILNEMDVQFFNYTKMQQLIGHLISKFWSTCVCPSVFEQKMYNTAPPSRKGGIKSALYIM